MPSKPSPYSTAGRLTGQASCLDIPGASTPRSPSTSPSPSPAAVSLKPSPSPSPKLSSSPGGSSSSSSIPSQIGVSTHPELGKIHSDPTAPKPDRICHPRALWESKTPSSLQSADTRTETSRSSSSSSEGRTRNVDDEHSGTLRTLDAQAAPHLSESLEENSTARQIAASTRHLALSSVVDDATSADSVHQASLIVSAPPPSGTSSTPPKHHRRLHHLHPSTETPSGSVSEFLANTYKQAPLTEVVGVAATNLDDTSLDPFCHATSSPDNSLDSGVHFSRTATDEIFRKPPPSPVPVSADAPEAFLPPSSSTESSSSEKRDYGSSSSSDSSSSRGSVHRTSRAHHQPAPASVGVIASDGEPYQSTILTSSSQPIDASRLSDSTNLLRHLIDNSSVSSGHQNPRSSAVLATTFSRGQNTTLSSPKEAHSRRDLDISSDANNSIHSPDSFRRTVGQQHGISSLNPNYQAGAPYVSEAVGSSRPPSDGTSPAPLHLSGPEFTTFPSLAGMANTSALYRAAQMPSAGQYPLHHPTSTYAPSGAAAAGHRKASSSIFDAFAPLGSSPAPSQHSHIPSGQPSVPPPPPSSSSAASKQAQRANHPNAPFERAAVDSLASQLAATSLSGPAHVWPRRSGVVKFFNSTKGFGFIWDNLSNEIGEVDIFVHWTTIQGDASFKSLAEGEVVEYELGRGPKGLQALNVTGPGGVQVQGDPLARMPLSISRFNPMSIPIPVHPMMLAAYPAGQAGLDAAYTQHFLLPNGRFVQQQHPSAFFPQMAAASHAHVGGHTRVSSNRATPIAGPPSAYQQYLAATGNPGQLRPDSGRPGHGLGPSHSSPFDEPAGPARHLGAPGQQSSRFPAYSQQVGTQGYPPMTSTLSATSIHHLNETSNPAGPLQPRERTSLDSDSLGIFGNGAWRKDSH